jgi:translation initiation factor 3 subunit C
MEKLENELYKSLQFNTNNNAEYSNCILNELKFLTLCKKIESFYKNYKNIFCIAKIYLLVIMHTYYKTNNQVKNLVKKFNLKLEEDDYVQKIIINNDKEFFRNLCNQVYQTLDEESKVKVMLYQIYFLCVRNDYESATKLFNSSNIYELISLFKTETLKVLFNRTLAQLGLCAFKNLDLEEVLKYLTPLCTKGPTKLKEYLSQSYNKDSEKNALFDRGDKMRTIPTIMRINANDLDTIFYLSSMINDVPKILYEKIFGKENEEMNSNSHAFERLFYNFQRQQFNGPSNIDKDKILATTTLLMKGDWKKCVEVIKNLNIIKKYSTLQDKLFELIKRTALKCFIMFYMSEYESFEFNNLCKRFEIKDYEVKNIINDMILTGKIKAKWNGNFLLMKSNDRDSVLNMKKLIENIQTITRQNLELMQTAMALTNND